MYLVIVIALAVVLPVASAVVELLVVPGSDPLFAFGRWFLFWGVGVRLFTAGISQIARPQFTVKNILGQDAPGANLVVQELGFANVGFGGIGLIAPWVAGWPVPAAIAPAVFLALAGIRHIVKKSKNTKETIATLTDLLVAAVLIVFVIGSLLAG